MSPNANNVYAVTIDNWLNEKQKEYKTFLDDLFLGKTIVSFANEWVGRHEWKNYEIKNIKEVKANGGYFYPEISVKDENGTWYTLLNSREAKFI